MVTLALLAVGTPATAPQVFKAAITSANDLIVKAYSNVLALDTSGLASCGLAVCGDPSQVAPAIDYFQRAREVTVATGVVAATVRLFDLIVRHDRQGLLAIVRDAIHDV